MARRMWPTRKIVLCGMFAALFESWVDDPEEADDHVLPSNGVEAAEAEDPPPPIVQRGGVENQTDLSRIRMRLGHAKWKSRQKSGTINRTTADNMQTFTAHVAGTCFGHH